MKIRLVVLDLEIPPRVKRAALRIALPFAIVAGVSGVCLASVPHTFSKGDALSSAAINDNFASLDQRVTALSTNGRVVVSIDGGTSYSTGFTQFCGETGAVDGKISNGALVGYAAAKKLCEAATGCSPSAHMCTTDEVVRLAQMGAPPPGGGWISSGVVAPTAGPTQDVGDCDGWTITTDTVTHFGFSWAGAFTGYDACTASRPVLCCD